MLAPPGDENWHLLPNDQMLNGAVYSLAAAGDSLYVGGDFAVDGPIALRHVARWNGSIWQSLGTVIGGSVTTLAVAPNGDLIAGGFFSYPGNNIARWSGSTWTALGDGIAGGVDALAVSTGSVVYAGGWFSRAAGLTVNGIAQWDGAAWRGLGSGMGGLDSPYVHALALDATGDLYAGGRFTTAGGAPALHVARWNGAAWSGVGSGVGDPVAYSAVYELMFDGSGALVAAGDFYAPAGSIARFDGSTWQPLGAGLGGWVWDLASDGAGNLYAGGEFATAGGSPAANVAKWNGSSWSALGPGTNATVNALSTDTAGNLYAGGRFTSAGGQPASNVARWDGSTWSAVTPTPARRLYLPLITLN